MSFKDLAQGAIVFWEKHNTKILTAVGIAGAIITPVLASRATLKAEKVIWEFNEKNNKLPDADDEKEVDNGTVKEAEEVKWWKDIDTLKKVARIYGVSVGSLVLTIASIIYCDKIHVDKELELAAVSFFWEEKYKKLEKKLVNKLGDEAVKDIKKEIAKEEKKDENSKSKKSSEEKSGKKSSKENLLEEFWVYDPITDQKFKTCWNNIIWTIAVVNEKLRKGHIVTWSYIICLLGGKKTAKGDALGYDPMNEDFYEMMDYNSGYFGMDAYWLDIYADMHVAKDKSSQINGTQIPYIGVSIDPWDLVPFR